MAACGVGGRARGVGVELIALRVAFGVWWGARRGAWGWWRRTCAMARGEGDCDWEVVGQRIGAWCDGHRECGAGRRLWGALLVASASRHWARGCRRGVWASGAVVFVGGVVV